MRYYRRLLSISYKNYITNEEARRKVQTAIGDYDELLALVKKRKIDGITGRTWSFERLQEESQSLAANLCKLGLRPRQVACLFGTNRPEFAHIINGVAANNAALTIANSQLTPAELSQQLRETETKILFVTPDVARKGREAAALTESVKEVIVVGDYEGCRPFASLVEKDSSTFKTVDDISPADDVVLIPYSSGTTGLPKGVQLTHRNLVSELSALSHPLFLPFSDGEKSLSTLPMVHIAGLVIGMLNPLSQGATVVTLPRFEPETFLQAIQKYTCTFSLIAPPIVNLLANHPLVDKYDISSLHTPYSGAAALGRELTEKMVNRLGLTGIRQGYGMSEASPATHTTPLSGWKYGSIGEPLPNTESGWKYGSIGEPLPNTESKVVDLESGKTLSEDERGEIWVRGPQVMKGYLNNDQATKDTITEDGWLKTGDIGYFDSEGQYFVVDRVKEIIKYKGYQVAPAYLEAILLQHEDVDDAAVVGIPDKVGGEVPRAYVVLKRTTREEQLLAFVNDQVAPYKRLRGGIETLSKLPRSPSGKILRRQLLKDYLAKHK